MISAERIVLRGLASLRVGRLDVELPDGRRETFGARAAPDEAPDHAPERLRVRLKVRDPAFFRRVLLDGETGAGVSYIEGEWETDDLVGLVRLGIANRDALRSASVLFWIGAGAGWLAHRLRRNSVGGARRNVRAHYDLGNDFFRLFLDETLTYSCAWFGEDEATLAEAQRAKYRRLADAVGLEAGDRVLEIGCGWGGFAEYAAGERGARVTALTVSREQAEFARRRMARAGLEERVEVELRDYRRVTGRWDRVVSIEMAEAVGHEYLEDYFRAIDEALAPGGRAAIQVITLPDRRYRGYRRRPDFIQRYVFPGAHLPSLGAMARALGQGSRLVVRGLEDIGPHYAETLRRWRRRFLDRRDEARALGYDEPFLRLWEFYLAYCEAGFLSRYLQDHQLVLSRTEDAALGVGPYGRGEPAREGRRARPGATRGLRPERATTGAQGPTRGGER